jgi:hypothetical protein
MLHKPVNKKIRLPFKCLWDDEALSALLPLLARVRTMIQPQLMLYKRNPRFDLSDGGLTFNFSKRTLLEGDSKFIVRRFQRVC